MKKKYRISTGLSEIKEQPEFDTDQEAWEYLRKQYDTSKYAYLFRQEKVIVPIVNRKKYIEHHDKKYTSQKIGDKPIIAVYWVPVLCGVTGDKYKNVK